MSTPYEYDPDRAQFGQILKRWFRKNGWPQAITEHWAKAVGSSGPWASQVSAAMNGKLDPKAQLFMAWGAFNTAVAEQDFRQVTDRRILDLLKGAQPLAHDNGTPYGPSDFFSLFTGLIEPPMEYDKTGVVTFTEEGAVLFSEALNEAFKTVARNQMLSPREAWEGISSADALKNFGPTRMTVLQDVLRGADTVPPEMMGEVYSEHDNCCPVVEALVSVAGREGAEVRESLFEVLEMAQA